MNVALIGIGLMGQALAEHLIAEGVALSVFNRTAEKVESLQHLGADVMTSAQTAVEANDVCLLMLSDAQAINEVLDTVSSEAFNNTLFIQMGTIAPEQSRAISTRIQSHQGRYLECPVLGSLPEARTGKLILMAAGELVDFDQALPLLNHIGHNPRYMGTIGQGATVKLAMNQLIAGLTASFALSLALVEKEGIETEQFMQIVRDSALYAPTFDKKLDRMLQQDFSNPNFPTKHLAKDVTLFLEVATSLGLDVSALKGIEQLLNKTLEQGLANTDYSAIYSGIVN